MGTMRTHQSTRHVPAHDQSVSDTGAMNEYEYDDVWPVRLPSSTRRYQTRGYAYPDGERNTTIPPRRTAAPKHMPARQIAPPPSRVSAAVDDVQKWSRGAPRFRNGELAHRKHMGWLVVAGCTLTIMLLGWVALSALGSWWQTTLDDWHFGRPRTFQIDQVVGHHDSPLHPSHFIALNLHRHILIIELPAGDPSKSVVFSGPILLGPGQDLAPVTLSFRDVNHDGTPDMLVSVQGSLLVFLNLHGSFLPPSQDITPTGYRLLYLRPMCAPNIPHVKTSCHPFYFGDEPDEQARSFEERLIFQA